MSIVAYHGGYLISKVDITAVPAVIEADINKDLNTLVPRYTAYIKRILRKGVSVRTGKLLDTLLNSLVVQMVANTLVVSVIAPAGYPTVITRPANIGEVGWGPKYTPMNNIPNRQIIRETPKGAYYLLNDPEAVSDYNVLLQTYILPTVDYITARGLGSYDVTISIPATPAFPVHIATRADFLPDAEIADAIADAFVAEGYDRTELIMSGSGAPGADDVAESFQDVVDGVMAEIRKRTGPLRTGREPRQAWHETGADSEEEWDPDFEDYWDWIRRLRSNY